MSKKIPNVLGTEEGQCQLIPAPFEEGRGGSEGKDRAVREGDCSKHSCLRREQDLQLRPQLQEEISGGDLGRGQDLSPASPHVLLCSGHPSWQSPREALCCRKPLPEVGDLLPQVEKADASGPRPRHGTWPHSRSRTVISQQKRIRFNTGFSYRCIC